MLEDALQRNAGAQRVRRHLIDIYVRRDCRKEALEHLDHLPAETPHREALRGAIRGACLAATRNWVPALAYLQTAYTSGCRDVLCLRWLAAALIASSQRDAALPMLREWQALEPRNVEVQKYLEMFTPPAPVAEAPPPILAPMTPDPVEVDTRRLRIDPARPAASGTAIPAPRYAGGPAALPAPARPTPGSRNP